MNELHNQTLKKTRILWITVITLGVILISAIGGYYLVKYRNQQIYAGYINEGDDYYESGQYEKAVASYRKAIDINEKQIQGYEGAGRSYIELQEYSMARVFLKKGHEITGAHTLEALYDSIKDAENGMALETMEAHPDKEEAAATMDNTLVKNLGSFTYKQYKGSYGEDNITMEGDTCVISYKKLNAKAYYAVSQDNPVVSPQTGRPFDGMVPTYMVFQDLSVLFPMWENGIPFHTLQKLVDGTAEVKSAADGSYLVLFSYLNCNFEITCDEGGNITDVGAANKVTPLAVSTEENMGTIIGSVVDAVSGLALDSVSIKVVDGTDSESGTVIQEVSSDLNGEFSVKVPEGDYTIEYAKDGYVTVRSDVPVSISANSNESLSQTVMSPTLGEGEWRIVLKWGSQPQDLDLHVFSDDYHVYFDNPSAGGKNDEKAVLDTDDQNGEGPETITITNMQPDVTYFICVDNYSYYGHGGDHVLSDSEATVTVYSHTGEVFSFSVPDGIGNIWNVVEFTNGSMKEYGTIVRGDATID